eukprot:UN08927
MLLIVLLYIMNYKNKNNNNNGSNNNNMFTQAFCLSQPNLFRSSSTQQPQQDGC